MAIKKPVEAMIRYLVRETRYTEQEFKTLSLKRIELMYRQEVKVNKEG